MKMHRDQVIARIVDAYLGNVSDAAKAYQEDALYYQQIQQMWRLLEVFDLAMSREDICATTRLKILQRVMMAAPDPAEALKRIEIMKNTKVNLDWLKER